MIIRVAFSVILLLFMLILFLALAYLIVNLYNAHTGRTLSLFQLLQPTSRLIDRTPNTRSQPVPSIKSIQRQMDLTLLTTNLSTTGRGKLEGFTGSIQAAIEAHGQAKWGVDWQNVTLKPDPAKPDKLILAAPEPEIQSVHVDVQESQVEQVRRRGLWFILPMPTREDQAVQQAYQAAHDQFEQHAKEQTHLIPSVKEQFEQAVKPVLERTGWQVEVEWRE